MRRVASLLTVLALAVTLAACGETQQTGSQQPQGASLRVRLGTQAFPEARILGELWRQALAVNGYTVDLRKGIGPAEDLDAALRAGEIDGYVAYTGTVLSIVAGQDISGLDPEQTYERAKAHFAENDMSMSSMTPFENKDAIATTVRFAQDNRLRTIADLGQLDGFTLGARPEFDDLHLGLAGLREVYGLTGAQFTPIPLGEQYTALDDGVVDAVNAFTTDPQLRNGKYTVLEDPQHLFGAQNVTMVVSDRALGTIESEAFLAVVNAVNEKLTEDAMIEMNARVTDGRPDDQVATEFLRGAGLMQPLRR